MATLTLIKNNRYGGAISGSVGTDTFDDYSGTFSNLRNGTRYDLTAIPNTGYTCDGWEEDGATVSTNEHLNGRVMADAVYLTVYFSYLYSRTLQFDSTMGTAQLSLTDDTNANGLALSATPNTGYTFIGWYVDGNYLNNSLATTYTLTQDSVIEARFESIYTVTTSVEGGGSVSYTRGSDPNSITFSASADEHYVFSKFTINGTDYERNPLTIRISSNVNVVAIFINRPKLTIYATTNVEEASIYISENAQDTPYTSILWARPLPRYEFIRWSDGVIDNPRTISVSSDVYLTAEYQKTTDANAVYQYRCYVKDQLDLTKAPIAFMVVESFDIKTDLLTNANSTVTVLAMQSNVSEGDILVLYDPKGTTLYQGVIKTINENKITCSQMQSFYKGQWIYNRSKQDFLEHEIAVLLQDYADGKMYQSSYVDERVAERLGGITIGYVGSTVAKLPTTHDPKHDPPQVKEHGGTVHYEIVDMEKWIYELYETYSIVFDFQINFSGTNTVTIKTTNFDPLKVGSNMYAIQDVSPVTTIEETNRLIVYSAKDNKYRTTWVATETNKYKATDKPLDRFKITNTKIVFSDDSISDLVAANLPEQMYNHKVTFTLLIPNFVYEFEKFHLGQEIEIYHNNEYINSVLTGYKIKKAENKNVTQVEMTCGKVRQRITNLLTMGKV